MNKDPQNIFIEILNELGIKHTRSFSVKYFNEHPHKNNMYGISKMLSDYHIENEGLRINDKSGVFSELEPPFIAQNTGDLVTVTKNTPEKVEFLWHKKRISVLTDEFIKHWSGVVLLVESDKDSGEPNYQEHRKQDIIFTIKKTILALTVILFLGIVGFSTKVYMSIGFMISLLINLCGLYISYLLVLKQMNVQSSYADKICSLFVTQKSCNNILESDASKFLGIFSWSEIGLGYFFANVLMILFFPFLYPYIALINICSLPYSVWSVCYQKIVSKQWCPLCLLVQVTFWLLFLSNLLFGFIQWPYFTIHEILLSGCLYAFPILLLNIIIPRLSDAGKMEQITQEINSMKADEEIFKVGLKDQPKYEVNKYSSSILWGSPDAKNLITIVTNPHCNPCAKMHTRLVKLLNDTNNRFCMQYIFSTFKEELEESSILLITMYQKMDIPSFLDFLEDWYVNGKKNSTEFYKKHPFDRQNEAMTLEFQKHKEWLNVTNIKATPTILFNGYTLPEKYKVEDLVYFTDSEII